MKIKLNCE